MIFVGFWRTFFSVFVVNITRCFSLFYFLTLFSLFESNCNKTVSGLFSCQSAVFTEDFAKARTQVMSNSVVGQIINASGSEEGIDWMGILNYILGNGASRLQTPGSDDVATVKVDIVSIAGTISFESKKLVFEGEADEKHTFSGISVNAILSGKTISITATGKLEGDEEEFNLSATITIDTSSEKPINIESSDEDKEKIGEIIGIISESTLADSKETTVKANGLKAILSIKIAGIDAQIPVTVSIDGDVLLTTQEEGEDMRVILKLDSLKASVESKPFGNVSVSIKGLDFGITITSTDNEVSISVSEVSLSGTLLPKMDNIRLKAKMKGFEFDSTGIIAIDTIEATVLGYENISIAAKVEDFRVDTDDVQPSFKFGAAVSFESQTIGIRGELFFLKPIKLITVLNGTPVTKDSLIELVVGVIGGDRV